MLYGYNNNIIFLILCHGYDKVMERCFTGTSSRIKGAGFAAIYDDLATLHLQVCVLMY